jgi:hypothetical protein
MQNLSVAVLNASPAGFFRARHDFIRLDRASMKIGQAEAMDLLEKWRDESRFIGCLLLADRAEAKIVGRIDRIEDGAVLVSGLVDYDIDSPTFNDKAVSMKIPLAEAQYEYQEPGPETLDEPIVVESQLLLRIPNGVVFQLAVIHPINEWRDRIDPKD